MQYRGKKMNYCLDCRSAMIYVGQSNTGPLFKCINCGQIQMVIDFGKK